MRLVNNFYHVPIMTSEVISYLITSLDGIYIDGTLGGGGHSTEILKSINYKGKLIGIDRDMDAINNAKFLTDTYHNFTCIHNNFHNMSSILDELNIDLIDGCILDLGVSSHQLDSDNRGFSVHYNSPLDMRMDSNSGITAAEYLNSISQIEFEKTLYTYSDEKWAKKIAEELIKFRQKKPLKTTFDLVEIVDKAIPRAVRLKTSGHPAIKTFQAVRIAINDEINPLYDSLVNIVKRLKSRARLCVLTFHSVEDRIVKKCFKTMQNPCTCDPKLPICICGKKSLGHILTKKPILANEKELKLNPRSHSAKLRVFEKI